MKKKSYSIHEAKTSLSKLIQEALRGEEVIISKRNVPLVKLTLLKSGAPKLGGYEGKMKIASDFDATPADFKDYL